MEITKRRFERAGEVFNLDVIDARGDNYMSATGTSFHGHAIDELTGGGTGPWVNEVVLWREPENKFDPDAIAVVSMRLLTLAHLKVAEAQKWAAYLDEIGMPLLVTGEFKRREPTHHWGLVLHFDRRVFTQLDEMAAGNF